MQLFKKSKGVDYMCKYGAYELSYMKHIKNYDATTKLLT